MQPRLVRIVPIVCLALLVLMGASSAQADRREHIPTTIVDYDQATRAKKARRLTTIVDIPNDLDQSRDYRFSCFATVFRDEPFGKPVKGVKTTFRTRIDLFDHPTGAFESFMLSIDKMKTNGEGTSEFALTLPAVAALTSSDAFEEGDVTAQIINDAEFGGSKKTRHTRVQCYLGEFDR